MESLLADTYAPAPSPAYRLIPSQFPPIGLFDTVATAADLNAVTELAGWTNDRLVAHRIARLPQSDWVYGRANASIVMAAFLHVAPAGVSSGGMRFNNGELGAWYAAASLTTAAAEVGHHLRREAVDRGLERLARTYRSYTCKLLGSYLDIRGQNAPPDVYASDSYLASQQLGEAVRAKGGDGIVYVSLRHHGGTNVVAHRPRNIQDILQADHFIIQVLAASPRIEVRKLSS
jgi:hypothetical protein